MIRVRKAQGQELETALANYASRPAKFSGDILSERQKEFDAAYAMNRLEGAGNMSETEQRIAQLWISGRISNDEYIELCDFDLQTAPKRGPELNH